MAVVDLAKRLIAAKSVTPARGDVFAELEAMLVPMGFAVTRFIAGEGDSNPDNGGPVENLFAIRKPDAPKSPKHFAFAGHLDVVPEGKGWESDAYAPEIRGDLLYGRGAVDMKGSIAAFVAALSDIPDNAGTISMIITGDEEGPAVHGTRALIDHMQAHDNVPDLCLVGEPTSVNRLGDMVKIGRRGSVNMWISTHGTQGHVAYPHLADNPLPRLVKALSAIEAIELDQGSDWFQASNIEITDLHVGNPAHNVIPERAEARISCRFNDLHCGDDIVARVKAAVEPHGASVKAIISGESFLTPPGDFSAMIAEAIQQETGVETELSTTGGTSDARFLSKICPVIEFGLCNATMHKVDEAVAIADLDMLTRIYARLINSAFS